MNTLKNAFLGTFIAAVLCVGTASALQLRSTPKKFTCGGTCSMTQPCAIAGCVCSFTTPTTAFCTTKLAGVAPQGK